MSFGCGVGDFIAVGSLALRLYVSYREGPNDYRELTRELLSLHTTLEQLRSDTEDSDSILARCSPKKLSKLEGIVGRCNEALLELDDICNKYIRLEGVKKRDCWKRLKFGKENIDGIRHNLGMHLRTIQLFLTSVTQDSLGRVERKIEEKTESLHRLEEKVDTILAEFRRFESRTKKSDKRATCTVLSRFREPSPRRPADQLGDLVNALQDDGVSVEELNENFHFISALVLYRGNNSMALVPAANPRAQYAHAQAPYRSTQGAYRHTEDRRLNQSYAHRPPSPEVDLRNFHGPMSKGYDVTQRARMIDHEYPDSEGSEDVEEGSGLEYSFHSNGARGSPMSSERGDLNTRRPQPGRQEDESCHVWSDKPPPRGAANPVPSTQFSPQPASQMQGRSASERQAENLPYESQLHSTYDPATHQVYSEHPRDAKDSARTASPGSVSGPHPLFGSPPRAWQRPHAGEPPPRQHSDAGREDVFEDHSPLWRQHSEAGDDEVFGYRTGAQHEPHGTPRETGYPETPESSSDAPRAQHHSIQPSVRRVHKYDPRMYAPAPQDSPRDWSFPGFASSSRLTNHPRQPAIYRPGADVRRWSENEWGEIRALTLVLSTDGHFRTRWAELKAIENFRLNAVRQATGRSVIDTLFLESSDARMAMPMGAPLGRIPE